MLGGIKEAVTAVAKAVRTTDIHILGFLKGFPLKR
jgi:hypothetical protein